MEQIMKSYQKGKVFLQTLTVSGCMLLAPFSSLQADEVPEEAFTLARDSIDEALEVQAGEVASDELLLAEQKLQKAREYNDEGEEEAAERLLRESRLHSEYAEILAMENTADNSLAEINDTLRTLEDELRRQQ
jgi:hypothetical protein